MKIDIHLKIFGLFRPTSEIQSLLESTGKKAVVLGTSGSKNLGSGLAAVAMLGGLVGAGNIQGVIRFVQVRFSFGLLFLSLD
jgi:hypothetical protein